ncbi:DNA-directed RNA polymerase subunit beta' [Candidatus Peregrinibacteria bacterium HGW-Peregrinibacteria-1]|jgi:DNA-directed RNA polymerase subunit beta'|nr:MAG: DNA-directed RNA polymerase subunit beta' [Candidatus Peregrinibacteria bacterium HGW-Peregrinibacteria-1]
MDTNQTQAHQFNSIALSIASPDEISSWSHGEVKKPETINYRTQKPERDGLFCEKIFGPTKNYECYCGKYKRARYKGVICEKCGVEVTRSSVRRERMGHIKLAVPVTHIWFLRSTPSRIGLLLDLPIKTLEQVVYFAAYIVSEVDETARQEVLSQLEEEYRSTKKKIQQEFKEKSLELEKLDEDKTRQKETINLESEYARKIEDLDFQNGEIKENLEKLAVGKVYSELEYRKMSMKYGHIFKAGTGAETLRDIIGKIDLKKLITELEEEAKKSSGQKHKKIIKRIKLAGSLLKSGVSPEWFIMTILPVIPPDLRPMVQLDGGRFAASDLNDLYRRVINRNNRLRRLMEIGAPEVICRNEKRMLQEAVDTLLNNSARQGRTAFNAGDKRKLRSLSDMLKGKQGRFRQNLLGKRVDYSGRSVITIGPNLKLHQCGVPKLMAIELFKPFIMGRLIRDGYAHNIKNAEKLIQEGKREVWDILEEVTKDHYVLLNRAPTLHRLGIQAFQPILIEGKSIQVHPLVCLAFNADFDGDQMAIHVPLSKAAQQEAKTLMVSSNNLLKPSAGEPIVTPTQDMVLGCYYLTKLTSGKKGEGMVFTNVEEAVLAYQSGHVELQAAVKARHEGEIIETTVGRLIFNSYLPEGLSFINENMDKNELSELVTSCYELLGEKATAHLVDNLKHIGFKFATKSGISIGQDDMIIPDDKEKIVEETSAIVKEIGNYYWKGIITDDERYLHTIKVWSEAKSKITTRMINSIDEDNNIFYMIDSGARGNWGQITQLCGIKGLVANPAGKTIELPITSNLKEGFQILEYFIATHGGRKGKSDTALKTAEAGYLTRRLVDANQDVIIREQDCNSNQPHTITRAESEQIGEHFETRIYGRVLAVPLADPKTGEIVQESNTIIEKETIKKINAVGIDSVEVRSVMTCNTEGGICVKCYGKDLGTNRQVQIGTAVGIIAAQSIGEPGTQLTMRTFHMGGVAEGSDITQGLNRVQELFEARTPKNPAIIAELDGIVKVKQKGKQTELILTSHEPVKISHPLLEDMKATVEVGDKVKAKGTIAKGVTQKASVKALESGIVREITPLNIVIETEEPLEKVYKVPHGRTVKVSNNATVAKGQPLTNGHLDLKELMNLTDNYIVQKYIVTEVQTIYASQGQSINDKHIEIIARSMLSKIRILEGGDSRFLPGEIVDIITFTKENQSLIDAKKNISKGERLLLGLTRVALYTESWLSAASFQETVRVLVEASTTNKLDSLEGLKENVIIGKLIPAGETYRKKYPHLLEEGDHHELTSTHGDSIQKLPVI